MKKRILEFQEIEDAVQEVLNAAHINFDIDHTRRVIEQKENLKYKLTQLLEDLAIPGKYRNESTTNHQLHKGPPIVKIKSINDQVVKLRELFPGIKLKVNKKNFYDNPNRYGDPFILINWEAVAPTYKLAVGLLIEKMKECLGDRLKITCKGFDPENLVQTDRTIEAFAEQVEDHGGVNTIFLYASLYNGSGTSIRKLLETSMSRIFGLGTFETGLILMTHLDCLRHEYLRINCAGDEYFDNYRKQLSFNLMPEGIIELEATQLYSYRDSDRVSAVGCLDRKFKD